MTDERIRWSKVDFPDDADPDAAESVEVYLNGIKQVPGDDYEVDAPARAIYFFKPIRKEGKLGWWRWLWITIGVVGSYRQNDSVDVHCLAGGRRSHHVNLPIDVLVEPDEQQKADFVHTGSYSPGG